MPVTSAIKFGPACTSTIILVLGTHSGTCKWPITPICYIWVGGTCIQNLVKFHWEKPIESAHQLHPNLVFEGHMNVRFTLHVPSTYKCLLPRVY